MTPEASDVVPASAMIFTLDEELHLQSCLASLQWCDDIVVIDSFSGDRTVEIARAAGARVLQNRFTGFGDQRNWALANAAPKHPWVLILDADERVPREMVEELRQTLASVPEGVAAFRMARRFHFWGSWLRYSSLYPTYVVRLVRCGRVSYVNRGHAETQQVNGEIGDLASDLIDENLKGLDEWFERQNRYSGRDAEFELQEEVRPWQAADLANADPLIRRAALKRFAASIPGRPLWYFIYAYVLRGGFLDGRNGLVFCLMKSFYQAMVVMKKYELRRSHREG
jgi:glycosyltransferase involved in cell wall biosynthesis